MKSNAKGQGTNLSNIIPANLNMLSIKTFLVVLAVVVSTSASKTALRTRKLTECDTLKACYLVNIKTRNETMLDGYDAFTIDPTNEKGYTIRCDVNGKDEMDFIKFKYNGTLQEEFGLPQYMFGDAGAGAYLNKVDYLSTCGRKNITIEGHVWSRKCFTKKYFVNARDPKGKPCASVRDTAPVKSPVMAPAAAPVAAPVTAPTLAPVLLTKTPTTTKTKFCANPFGNPCGPGSACTDTETGISCAPINLEGCPVGCGPNSTCMLQQNAYECICNTGFSRPQKYLPCVATP